MPECEGYVVDGALICPLDKIGAEVNNSQGDLFLCKHCEDVRFPTTSRLFYERQRELRQQEGGSTTIPEASLSTGGCDGVNSCSIDSQLANQTCAAAPIHEQLITNELLCFVSNKIDLIAHDVLVKICVDYALLCD